MVMTSRRRIAPYGVSAHGQETFNDTNGRDNNDGDGDGMWLGDSAAEDTLKGGGTDIYSDPSDPAAALFAHAGARCFYSGVGNIG
jgi:hypothetical protein